MMIGSHFLYIWLFSFIAIFLFSMFFLFLCTIYFLFYFLLVCIRFFHCQVKFLIQIKYTKKPIQEYKIKCMHQNFPGNACYSFIDIQKYHQSFIEIQIKSLKNHQCLQRLEWNSLGGDIHFRVQNRKILVSYCAVGKHF